MKGKPAQTSQVRTKEMSLLANVPYIIYHKSGERSCCPYGVPHVSSNYFLNK